MSERQRWLRHVEVRRAQRAAALAFLVSAAGAVGFAVVYALGGQTQMEGITLGVAFAGLAVGLGIWGRRLLAIGGHVEPRSTPQAAPSVNVNPAAEPEPETPAAQPAVPPPVVGEPQGEDEGKRRWLLRLLGLSAGAIGAAALFPLRSLVGPRGGVAPGPLKRTAWREAGLRLVDPQGRPVRASEVTADGILIVFPEGHHDSDDSVAFVVRLDPARMTAPPPGGQINGIVAYSLLCTHAGCPVALYQQTAARMVCPCHQSVFDLLSAARPVSGPAARRLPGLPITQDANGYLRATGDFTGPPGPGFWTRP